MKGQRKLCFVVLVAALLVSWGCSQNGGPASSPSSASESIKPFLGRWDLTIKTPNRERPSWIEISEKEGHPEILMVGFGGHAVPTDKVQIQNGTIEFTPPRVGYSEGAQFQGKLADGQLAGTITNPKGVPWEWTGVKAPSLQREGTPKWGKPIRLFNGKNLDGWRLRNPGPGAAWSVEHGAMVKTDRKSVV